MKVEKLELVTVNVKNLDEAVKLFSDILGTTFVNLERDVEKTKQKIAVERTGLMELIESSPPMEKEGVRSPVFKVPNVEQAKAEMKQKGIRLIKEIERSGFKEAIFSPDDLHGIRLSLIEYEAPTLLDAVQQK